MTVNEAKALLKQATVHGWVGERVEDYCDDGKRVTLDGQFTVEELEAITFLIRAGQFDYEGEA